MMSGEAPNPNAPPPIIARNACIQHKKYYEKKKRKEKNKELKWLNSLNLWIKEPMYIYIYIYYDNKEAINIRHNLIHNKPNMSKLIGI